KPGNSQVNARCHCDQRGDPHPPKPESAPPAIRQQRSNKADHESAQGGRGNPAVPIQLGHKKSHCWVCDVTGAMHSQKHNTDRRIDSKQCKTVRPRDHVEEAKCHSEGKGEPAKCGNGDHDPKPMMSFMM